MSLPACHFFFFSELSRVSAPRSRISVTISLLTTRLLAINPEENLVGAHTGRACRGLASSFRQRNILGYSIAAWNTVIMLGGNGMVEQLAQHCEYASCRLFSVEHFSRRDQPCHLF